MLRVFWKPLFIACLSAAAWSAEPQRYPVRQIDRPLILPKGMWQERLTWTQALPFEEDYKDQRTQDIQGFLPNLPSWSITDNLSWSALPAPVFQYLLTRNNIRPGHPIVDDFSLTLDGGLIGLIYAREKLDLYSAMGMSFKKPWLGRFWSEGNIMSIFINADPFSVAGSLGIGIQITNRIHSMTGYSATQVFPDGPHLIQGVSQRLGINFTPVLSLDGSLAFLAGDGNSWVSPGAQLSFQW